MAAILSIPVSDAVLARLQEMANTSATTPEAIVVDHLETLTNAKRPPDDLWQWAGSIDSGLTDVAQNHHEYLGRAIANELRGASE